MILLIDLLKSLSAIDKKHYNSRNVKLSVKKDGFYESGRQKLKITIQDLNNNQIFESNGCETEKKVLLIDDSPLYAVKYEIQE
jgi:hypothetical protein